jgi:hypothetical protein
MKQTFRSAISLGLIVPVGMILAGILVLMFIQGAWQGVLIIAIVVVFIGHMFATTYYVIDGNKLIVKSGIIINIQIDIDKITKIVPTTSILSAPALSLDRLEIFYNKFDSVVISPGNKAEFIAALKIINGGIVVQ